MRSLAVACSLLFAWCAVAETVTRSTLCQTATVAVIDDVRDRRLVGCGEGFPDNLLWHLDRSDTVNGTLDTRVRSAVTGHGAVVYVIDLGILQTHNEFARATGDNVIAGINFGSSGSCPDPALAPCWSFPSLLKLLSHGTAVASVIAGARVGVAPEASLVSVVPQLEASNATQGLRAIITHAFAPTTPSFRTAIINISGGIANVNSSNAAPIDALIRRMVEGVDANGNADPNGKRFLFVTAAGNTGQCSSDGQVVIHPGTLGASIDGVITVGGLSKANTVWDGACKGPLVEVIAPAEEIFLASLAANDLYRFEPAFFISGTSYSTPYVSGMAARLLQMNPSLTPAEIEQRLKESPSRVDGIPVPVMESTITPPSKRRRSVH